MPSNLTTIRSFVEEAEGDYELLLTGSRARPIQLPLNVSVGTYPPKVLMPLTLLRIHEVNVP